MLRNSYSLEHLSALSAGEIDEIPLDDLKEMQEVIATETAELNRHKERINQSLSRRYEGAAREARHRLRKDTGRVTLTDGEFEVKADLPKDVTWSQSELRKICNQIEETGDDPEEYVKITFDVSEKSYTAWPRLLQNMFAPARTVGVGKATYKIERVKGGDE